MRAGGESLRSSTSASARARSPWAPHGHARSGESERAIGRESARAASTVATAAAGVQASREEGRLRPSAAAAGGGRRPAALDVVEKVVTSVRAGAGAQTRGPDLACLPASRAPPPMPRRLLSGAGGRLLPLAALVSAARWWRRPAETAPALPSRRRSYGVPREGRRRFVAAGAAGVCAPRPTGAGARAVTAWAR